MEQTEDLLADGFTVAGGSGIRTDGVWFWRNDAADYVERYRVALPAEFLRHARERQWSPPILSEAEVLDADRKVTDFYRASLDVALWPSDDALLVRVTRA